MKKWLCCALALCLVAGLLCGCGKKDKDSAGDNSGSSALSSAAPTTAPTPTPAPKAKAAKIQADGGLNIRAEASTDGEILGLAENGSMLPLLVENPSGGWYQVEYQGKTAYISAEYASIVEVSLEEYNQLKLDQESSGSSEDPQGRDDPQGNDDPQAGGDAAPTTAPVSSAPESSGDAEDAE